MTEEEFNNFYSSSNWSGGRPHNDYRGNSNQYGKWDHKTHFYQCYTTGGRGWLEISYDNLKRDIPSLPDIKYKNGEKIYWASKSGRDWYISNFVAAAVLYDHAKQIFLYVTPQEVVPAEFCYDSEEKALKFIHDEEDRHRGEITIMTKEQVEAQERARQMGNGPQSFSFRFG